MWYCQTLLVVLSLAGMGSADYLRFVLDQFQNTTPFQITPYTVNYNCTADDYGIYTPICDYNGKCIADGTCKCDNGYITWPANNPVGCNYKQKSQLVAFLLSLFLGSFSGAGEWYLNNTMMGLVQVLLCWTCIPVACLCGAATNSEACIGGMSGAQTLAVIVLWLYLWISIIDGTRNDGNGAPLILI